MTKVLGVVSGKGGVGKTTVAVNLSFALKNFKKRVVLIDANFSTPHISFHLGFRNYEYTLNDVLLGKVDILNAMCLLNGIKFIPASLDMKKLVGINPLEIEKHVNVIKRFDNPDYIILDGSPGLGRETLSVLKASEVIIFVTSPSIPSVNDVIRCKKVVELLGKDKKMLVVMNTCDGYSHEMPKEVVEKLTRLEVVGHIPFDKNVELSISVGIPVLLYKPHSLSSLSFKVIAAKLLGIEFSYPAKLKLHKWIVKIRNILSSKICFPRDFELIKDIFPRVK